MRTLGFFLALVLLVSLAGCTANASSGAEAVETSEVDMPPSYRFAPEVIRVPAGTTVTWRNSDNFTHSVSVAEGEFPFLNLEPGQSGTITFEEPGEYDYVCTYHSQDMKGRVIVYAP